MVKIGAMIFEIFETFISKFEIRQIDGSRKPSVILVELRFQPSISFTFLYFFLMLLIYEAYCQLNF